MRPFDSIRVSKGGTRVTYGDGHTEFFANFPLESRNNILTKIYVPARKFKHARQKLLGSRPLRQKYLGDTVKIMMNKSTSRNNLLPLRRSLAIVHHLSHCISIPIYVHRAKSILFSLRVVLSAYWYTTNMRTIKREIVGAFIFSSDGKLLLGKGGVYSGAWLVPGGGIDEGETKLEAIRREILEETEIDITDAETEELSETQTGQSEKTLRDTGEHVLVNMEFYNYIVTLPNPADKIPIKADDDFVEARWFSPEELKNLTLAPPTKIRLQKLGYLA